VGPDHVWRASVGQRTYERTGCPFCANRRLSITNSLAARYPTLAREWHPTKNGRLRPKDLAGKARKKIWWCCSRNGDHEWQETPAKRALLFERLGKPFCRVCHWQMPLKDSLSRRFPALAQQWDRERNGILRASVVGASSSQVVWWKCRKAPDHRWQAAICARVFSFKRSLSRKGAITCPFCANRFVSVTNSLAALHPEIAVEWHHEKNEMRPEEVLASSEHRCWWKCHKGPDHEWQASCVGRTKGGTGCPFCANRLVSVTNSLASLHPRLARQWHPVKNRALHPRDVVAVTKKVKWWKCPLGHEFRMSVVARTQGTGDCPVCQRHRARPATTRKSRRWVHLPES
jgi:hypothetical protein